MDIFNNSFLDSLKEKLVEVIREIFERMIEQQELKNRYMTTEDACSYVGDIDKSTLASWVERGLKKTKVVGIVRYDRKDIDAFMDKHKM